MYRKVYKEDAIYLYMVKSALLSIFEHQKKMTKLQRKEKMKRCSICKGLLEVNGYSGIPGVCKICA